MTFSRWFWVFNLFLSWLTSTDNIYDYSGIHWTFRLILYWYWYFQNVNDALRGFPKMSTFSQYIYIYILDTHPSKSVHINNCFSKPKIDINMIKFSLKCLSILALGLYIVSRCIYISVVSILWLYNTYCIIHFSYMILQTIQFCLN